MPGTPPVRDAAWLRQHPDWREAYHRQYRDHLDSLRRAREACEIVTIEGERHYLASLSIWDLEKLAETRVRASLIRSIRRRGDAIEIGRGL